MPLSTYTVINDHIKNKLCNTGKYTVKQKVMDFYKYMQI